MPCKSLRITDGLHRPAGWFAFTRVIACCSLIALGAEREIASSPLCTACDIRALRLHRLTGNHDDRGKDAPSLLELSTFRVGARGKYLGCSNEMVPKMGDNE
jgi:hypothetical protein